MQPGLTDPVLVLSLATLVAIFGSIVLAVLLRRLGCPAWIVRKVVPVGVVLGFVLMALMFAATIVELDRGWPLWLAIVVVLGIPELALLLLLAALVGTWLWLRGALRRRSSTSGDSTAPRT